MFTTTPSSVIVRSSTSRAANLERRNAPAKPTSSTARSADSGQVLGERSHHLAQFVKRNRTDLVLGHTLATADPLKDKPDLLGVCGRSEVGQAVCAVDSGQAALEGGHFVIADEVGQVRRDGPRRRWETRYAVAVAPGREIRPVGPVRPSRGVRARSLSEVMGGNYRG